MISFLTLYPRAHDKRVPRSSPSVLQPRRKFLKAATKNFILLQILFFSLLCYIFGALYQQDVRTHNLHILFVDYDHGVIGDSIRDAYAKMQSKTFPSLIEQSASDFPSAKDVKEAVCHTNYWGAIYVAPGSSQGLGAAISGLSVEYNSSEVLSYVWNEAVYPTVVDSAISTNIQKLSEAARLAYVARNGSAGLAVDNTTAVSIFVNPWVPQQIDLKATPQGSRAIYNTLVIILILMQDFYYLGVINGLYVQCKIYERLEPHHIIIFRDTVSAVFTMIGSLFVTSSIWIFRAGWDVNGKNFVLNWFALWLFAHVNFLTLDFFTMWIPAAYIPWVLIAWVAMNTTSILLPFALSSSFYRWAYALPGHEIYQVLTDNWSNGCNPQLRYALPILFAYEVCGLFWSVLGVYRRAHFAVIAEETQEETFRNRVQTALKLERDHDRRLREKNDEVAGSGAVEIVPDIAEKESPEDLQADKETAAEAIEKRDDEARRVESRASRQLANFGPAFHLPFSVPDTED
jgi:hypothetical protein